MANNQEFPGFFNRRVKLDSGPALQVDLEDIKTIDNPMDQYVEVFNNAMKMKFEKTLVYQIMDDVFKNTIHKMMREYIEEYHKADLMEAIRTHLSSKEEIRRILLEENEKLISKIVDDMFYREEY